MQNWLFWQQTDATSIIKKKSSIYLSSITFLCQVSNHENFNSCFKCIRNVRTCLTTSILPSCNLHSHKAIILVTCLGYLLEHFIENRIYLSIVIFLPRIVKSVFQITETACGFFSSGYQTLRTLHSYKEIPILRRTFC